MGKYDYKNKYEFSFEVSSKKHRIIKILTMTLSVIFLFLLLTVLSSSLFKSSDTLLHNRTFNDIKRDIDLNQNNEYGSGGISSTDIISSPVTYFEYTIRKGESIHSLAKKFNIDAVTIIKQNNIAIPSKISYGTKILIPNQDGVREKITSRNTLDIVAKKYSIDKNEILRVNNLKDTDEINEVFIPGMHFDSLTKSLILGEFFRRPAYGRFTSGYGYRKDPFTGRRGFHHGVDIANRRGGYIYAAGPGKVVYVGYSWLYGNLVKIQHTSGYTTYYGHLSKTFVKSYQWVRAGQVIGSMGSTGRSTGVHLHYEVRLYGRVINPFKVTVF